MTCPAPFEVKTLCKSSAGRTGTLKLGRGTIQTPVFMPVGTQAAIRAMPPHFLRETNAQIILANTYHLHQRPGASLIEKLGGLHRFMGVDLPILTDSGGFQVFSLRKKNVSEEGVAFAFELDGKQTFLSPESSMAIQMALGSDIAMAFDECLAPEADRATAEASVDLTARWAERSVKAHTKPTQSLFGIVQGGMFGDLRRRSVQQITSLPFDGFSIGGLSVGEGPEKMNAILGETMPHMPTGVARYLMGVGRPQDLVDGVAAGIDMFDCVIPTRHARGGVLYTFQGRIRISHGSYRRDAYPVDTACTCYTCTHFSRAYLHHLFDIGEVLGSTLATIHNLRFFADLMAKIRNAIEDGTFGSLRKDIKALYPEKEEAAVATAGADPVEVEDARKRFAKDARPRATPVAATGPRGAAGPRRARDEAGRDERPARDGRPARADDRGARGADRGADRGQDRGERRGAAPERKPRADAAPRGDGKPAGGFVRPKNKGRIQGAAAKGKRR